MARSGVPIAIALLVLLVAMELMLLLDLQPLPLPLQSLPQSLTHNPLTGDLPLPVLQLVEFREHAAQPAPPHAEGDGGDERVGGRGDEPT